MRQELQMVIAAEDKKQPFTDTELSKKFFVSREYITLLRKEMNIFDSRERKKHYICKEIELLLNEQSTVNENELLQVLKDKGYQISKYLLDRYLDDLEAKRIRAEVVSGSKKEDEAESLLTEQNASFKNLVGYDGSLETQIQQAKATMLYPPHGLHCLIVGETGVGKSELAEAMHKFSVESGCLPKEAPFVVFNCADYAENSQLLITQLFGCVKGAYTGAMADRKGLVEQTNGGILFLDEVHRLSSEGQEMLFQLIDRNCFRRLGEADALRKAQVQLIAATTENIDVSLLTTFKRRIPMLIKVPSLVERPLSERMMLIQKFFSYESARMNASIHIAADVVKAYLLYECKGNIGQLKSDIQVTCAKSFLTYVTKKESMVSIDMNDLNLHVKKGLMKINSNRKDIDTIVWKDLIVKPSQCQDPETLEDDIYSFPKEYYSYIENLYMESMQQGMEIKQIQKMIGLEIEKKLQTVITHVKQKIVPLSLEEISHVVGDHVIKIVHDVIEIAKEDLENLDDSALYCLAIHLDATLTRIRQGKLIMNPDLQDIKAKFRREYDVAEKMVAYIKKAYQIELPEDEIGYITLYLRGNEKENEGKVGVVIATHGNAGESMLEMANKLLNMNHGKAFHMSFEESPQDALKKLTTTVESCDEGKGVMLLVDMGSLLTFGEIIQERTKIQIETIDRVDMVMVMEVLRRSALPGACVENIVNGIENLNMVFPKRKRIANVARKKAMITICFTGEGSAIYCSRQMKKRFGDKLKDITLLHMGMIGKHDIYQQIQEKMVQYDILAIIGSVDPKFYGIPYFSLDEVFLTSGAERLDELIGLQQKNIAVAGMEKQPVPSIVEKSKFIIVQEGYTKNQILKKMCDCLVAEGYVKPNYYQAVMEREKLGSYLINQKIALPHADSSYVQKPIVFIAKMSKPVLWDGVNYTNIICLLALDIEGKDGIRYLYKKFQEEEVLVRLERAVSTEELREAILQ